MDSRVLERLGLTPGEAKVYVALLSLGSTKTGPLAKEAGVSSSKVYKILDRLQRKGLCGHVVRGGVNYFNAMTPVRILDFLDERQAALERERVLARDVLPELERLSRTGKKAAEATVLEGFRAVTNSVRNFVDELERGDAYYVIGANYGQVPGLREFFLKHHARRARKGVLLKMLANHDVKGILVPSTTRLAEIRYLPQYLISNMQIAFYKNKVQISIWTREPKAFLLESDEAVATFRAYFDAFWKIAEK